MTRFLLTASISVVWVALTAHTAPAQGPTVPTIPFEGPEIFCHILYSLGLEPVKKLQSDLLVAEDTVVVVFGRPAILDTIFSTSGALRTFRSKGGSLFVATDYRLDREGLPVVIFENPFRCNAEYGYRERTECPLLKSPWLAAPQHSSAHPIFRFLNQGIATNRPSRIDPISKTSPLRMLAEFPPYGQSRTQPREVAIAGSPANEPAGRTLVIAGNGMFVNGMMVQKDNDNFAFAVNAMQWLREKPGGGKRTHALFVVDGTIITNFNANLFPSPPIPMPSARMINRLLLGLLNEWLGQETNQVAAILIALTTLLLLIYGAKKMMEGRFLVDTEVPLFADSQPTTDVHESLMQQRQQALMGLDQFGETARAFLREWFRAEFGISTDKRADNAVILLEVKGWRWSARSLRRTAKRVLSLAYAEEPIKVTRRELLSLVQSLSTLRRAIEADRITLFVDGKRVRIAERRNAHE